MLDDDVRDLWVKDLRSGDYKQGRSQLRRDDEYCCLGILCLTQDDVIWRRYNDGHQFQATMAGDETEAPFLGYPPDEIMERVGLSSEAAEALVNMNDALESTFDDIADCIESGWVVAADGNDVPV